MAGFKGGKGNAYPETPHNKLVENDPMIVKVPMDTVDWGARSKTMGQARNAQSGGNRKLGIKHVGGEK